METDNSGAIIRPPLAWALAFLAGLGIDWLFPLPFVPARVPAALTGAGIFALGFLLAVWAISTIRKAGTQVETTKPTTAIVRDGPYRFTRNPIYIGMVVGQIGLAIGFDSLWVLAMLIPFLVVIRYGVIAREETYLERKFGDAYLAYKSQVRRWV